MKLTVGLVVALLVLTGTVFAVDEKFLSMGSCVRTIKSIQRENNSNRRGIVKLDLVRMKSLGLELSREGDIGKLNKLTILIRNEPPKEKNYSDEMQNDECFTIRAETLEAAQKWFCGSFSGKYSSADIRRRPENWRVVEGISDLLIVEDREGGLRSPWFFYLKDNVYIDGKIKLSEMERTFKFFEGSINAASPHQKGNPSVVTFVNEEENIRPG
ncbi:hypothetical protein ACFLU6_06485 [Acidobacteriota bacterium]